LGSNILKEGAAFVHERKQRIMKQRLYTSLEGRLEHRPTREQVDTKFGGSVSGSDISSIASDDVQSVPGESSADTENRIGYGGIEYDEVYAYEGDGLVTGDEIYAYDSDELLVDDDADMDDDVEDFEKIPVQDGSP